MCGFHLRFAPRFENTVLKIKQSHNSDEACATFTPASPPDVRYRLENQSVPQQRRSLRDFHSGFAARCEARLCLAGNLHDRSKYDSHPRFKITITICPSNFGRSMSISINKTAETVEFLNPTSKKTCATYHYEDMFKSFFRGLYTPAGHDVVAWPTDHPHHKGLQFGLTTDLAN